MAHEQKKAADDLEASGRLATGVSWQGVRTTAIDLVERFCTRMHLDPAQFLSAQGWMRSGQWQGSIDWRSMVNTRFDDYVRHNLREGGVGLNPFTFTRGLEGMGRPSREETARQPTAEQREEQRPAATAQRPEDQAVQAAQSLVPRSQMSTDVWARLYSATESVLDGFPMLNEDQRNAIHNIMDRAGPGNRRLVAVNLTSYLRELNGTRVLTDEQATNLYNSLVGSEERPGLAVQAENWVRDERDTRRQPEPTRMAAAGQRERPAPARAEIPVYRVQFVEPAREEGGAPRVLSTYEVVSPTPITNSGELAAVLHERPEGLVVTRIGAGGRRIRISGDQLDLYERRMSQLRFDPNHEIVITEQPGGRPRV